MNFNAKYSAGETDQILTEVFDYCRSLDPSDLVTNVSNGSYAQTGASGGTWGIGQVTPICLSAANFGGNYTTKGFGRFDTIDGVAIDFTQYGGSAVADAANPGDFFLTGIIYLSLFSPSIGYPWLDPHLRLVVSSPGQPGKINMTITTDDGIVHNVFGAPANGKNGPKTSFSTIPNQSVGDAGNYGWNNAHDGALLWGGSVGARQMVLDKYPMYSGSTTSATNPSPDTTYGLCGVNMEIPLTCKTFSMAATPLEIKIYHTNSNQLNATSGEGFDGAAADLVQDLIVTLPAFSNLPLPTNSKVGNNSGSSLYTRLWWSGYGPENNATYYLDNGDVVQSLVTGYNGDTRLVAAPAVHQRYGHNRLGDGGAVAFLRSASLLRTNQQTQLGFGHGPLLF